MLSLSTDGSESASNLEGILDDPLEASKGTNHEDSGTETLPESTESDLFKDLLDLGHSGTTSSSLVEDGDHDVSWMENNGAENIRYVTRHESDYELGALGVGALWMVRKSRRLTSTARCCSQLKKHLKANGTFAISSG